MPTVLLRSRGQIPLRDHFNLARKSCVQVLLARNVHAIATDYIRFSQVRARSGPMSSVQRLIPNASLQVSTEKNRERVPSLEVNAPILFIACNWAASEMT